MPYQKRNYQPGDTFAAEDANYIQTQYDEAVADLNAHKSASTLDHPDGSVTAGKLANGAVDTLTRIASGVRTTNGGREPNRLAVTNASGRVGDSELLGGLAPSAFAQPPLGINQLKTATGSARTSSQYTVHRYAFASPEAGEQPAQFWSVRMGRKTSTASTLMFRDWQNLFDETGSPVTATVIWDYLTASGNPRIWAVVDAAGDIHDMWEAEDPVDDEFPDDPPLHPDELPQSWAVVPLAAPTESIVATVMQQVQRARRPVWQDRSIFASVPDCPGLCDAVFLRALQKRSLEAPSDIREVCSAISDPQKRYWYLQLWLRSASRILGEHVSDTLIPLYRQLLRVDKRTGRLALK